MCVGLYCTYVCRSVESRSFCYCGMSPEANGSILRVMLKVTLLVLVTSCVLRVIGMLVSCLLLSSLEARGFYVVELWGSCIFLGWSQRSYWGRSCGRH
jgi:hypothetical protein